MVTPHTTWAHALDDAHQHLAHLGASEPHPMSAGLPPRPGAFGDRQNPISLGM